jgi:alpha-beta hydrolase superfamily lysophospholipase
MRRGHTGESTQRREYNVGVAAGLVSDRTADPLLRVRNRKDRNLRKHPTAVGTNRNERRSQSQKLFGWHGGIINGWDTSTVAQRHMVLADLLGGRWILNERPVVAGHMTQQSIRQRFKLGLLLLGVLVTLWLLASLAVAYRLTRRSQPPFPEPVPAVDWAKFESHRLMTFDGQEIGAWLAVGAFDAPSVLLIHGIGARRSACLSRAKMFADQGWSVLIISLRAHGDSTGEFNDMGYSARHDVVAAVEFLERRRPGNLIVVHGLSMGAGAAVFASGELAHRIKGYILESPYQDLKAAVRNRISNALPPILDRIAYLGLLVASPLVLPDLDKISPVEAIKGIPADVPVLILAGGEDSVARPDEAQAILDRVRSHGCLVVFEHAGHMNFPEKYPDLYQWSVLRFLGEINKQRS